MRSREAEYRFHDPNTADALTESLIGVFLEVGMARLESLVSGAEPLP